MDYFKRQSLHSRLIGDQSVTLTADGEVLIEPAGGKVKIDGDLTVTGNTSGPEVTDILYVTQDGNDLNDGKSSVLYKKMVDDKKMALAVQTINLAQEDYGTYLMLALPVGENTLEDLLPEIDIEVEKVQKDLISDRDLEKLQNSLETQFVNRNSSVEGIANSLADYYTFYGDTSLINGELDIYRSITKEEIREVANKYLKPNQRVVVDYLPGDENNKTTIE